MAKVGIMGGTFDPIHEGHLLLAKEAYEKFDLDQIWFLPNGRPPHKKQNSIGSEVKDRLAMVKLAIEGHPEYVLNTYEADRTETSCTYSTMEYFNKIYPEHDFYYIIGADSLFAIESWVHPERIFPTCTLLAAYRDDIDTDEEMMEKINYLNEKYHAKIRLLATSQIIHIASSALREAFHSGMAVNYIPVAVLDYIYENGLYGVKKPQAEG